MVLFMINNLDLLKKKTYDILRFLLFNKEEIDYLNFDFLTFDNEEERMVIFLYKYFC